LSLELGNKDGLERILGCKANILWERGDLDGALAIYKEQERICRELEKKLGLGDSLGNQALILEERGHLDSALSMLKEVEGIFRDLDHPHELSTSLANQALLLSRAPDHRGEARRLADEALAIATRHGYQNLVPQFQRIRDSISSSEP
jgi:tetratricopeptide (TPR) repeat protein